MAVATHHDLVLADLQGKTLARLADRSLETLVGKWLEATTALAYKMVMMTRTMAGGVASATRTT